MPDIVIKDVPETISLQLSSLAATEGIEVQESRGKSKTVVS